MRTLKLFTIVMAGLFIFSACGKKQTPEQVATKFINLLEQQKFEDAKKYGTAETIQILDMYKSLSAMSAGMAEEEDTTPGEIKDLECIIEGDKAICSYTIDGEFDQLPLVKQGDKWLVDLKKESPFDDAEFNWEEEGEEGEEEVEEEV
ncbi:MAG: DUF4878 domain-containing protein [Bacteroidetes bacterium]|nr:DUF4878 domain-containing protein [Bacteroidota bacterium]